MIVPSIVMDEEEITNNTAAKHNSVQHSPASYRLGRRVLLMSISRSQKLRVFYNDQCPVVNSTAAVEVELSDHGLSQFGWVL